MSQQPPTTEITVKGKAARIRGATWTHDQVKKLFDVWTQPDIYQGLLNEKKKLDIFKNMANILMDLGVTRTWRECRAKIKNLKADFRKAMDKKTPFRYFEEMKKIMNLDGSVASSSGTGGGRTIDTYFTPSRTSTPHSSQELQRRQELGTEADVEASYRSLSPITPEETSTFSHETPSTSRSVIQSVSHHQTQYHHHQQESSLHHSVGYQYRDDDSNSSSRRYTPLSSLKQSPYYSSTMDSEHFPHTSSQYYQKEQQQHSYKQDHSWRQLEETDDDHHRYHQQTQSPSGYHTSIGTDDNVVEHDSSSRSSMVITHVVSNVIEPITEVIMPSSSSGGKRSITEDIEIVHESAIHDSIYKQQSTPTPPPIRLEFVLDDENVILQPPQSPASVHEDMPDITATFTDNTSTQIESVPQSASTTPPMTTITFDTAADQTLKTPPSQILRRTRTQQKRFPTTHTPTKSRPSPKPTRPSKRKSPTIPSTSSPVVKPVLVDSKRRKLLETLNRQTVETISDLLTDTSQSLLKELQEAEQRFIQWEEEKRVEERKREELMFTKLIAAMQSSSIIPPLSSTSTGQIETEQETRASDNETSLAVNFSSMSKRINELVCGEVKQTEESLRQWETKMQRHESRHTEKLFGMIINAIRNSASHRGNNGD